MEKNIKLDWYPCEEFKKSRVMRSKSSLILRPTGIKTLPESGLREMNNVKKELKALLPSLNRAEIRRLRIPYRDAVLYELEENHYPDSAKYLRNLFSLDEEIRQFFGPDTLEWEKPRLENNKELIDILIDGLKVVEETKRKRKIIQEAVQLLKLALFFQSQSSEWWWIADELYKSSLTAGKRISGDEFRTITVIRYLYGRFLLGSLKKPEVALDYLNYARNSSEGKSWSASKILNEQQATIFTESNGLLYKALLDIGKNTDKENAEDAAKIYEEALHRAVDNGCKNYIAKALQELGRCCLEIGEVQNALRHFSKLLAMAKRIPDPDVVCSAYMGLAFTHKELGDHSGTEKYFQLARETALEFQLLNNLADAHYSTGNYYLNKIPAKPDLATKHLEKALELYQEFGIMDKAEIARFSAAAAKGTK
ncbi:uncharacterized protein [Prorops nasuta]|uniref:uncharacterized protein n=1 Tax=Prorops nasuta TaxID=863751 RepID=UPI0034CE9031